MNAGKGLAKSQQANNIIMNTRRKEDVSGDEQLCVKGLAFSLGVSTRYVYEMRRCGFSMAGLLAYNKKASHAEAVQWIEANDFRMVDGIGKVQKSANSDA